jgi:heat shock protein HslJ
LRKILLVIIPLLVSSALLLTACSSDSASSNLAGTSWKLVSYGPADDQTPAAGDVETSLDFGKDGKVSGRLGCNQFSGDYSLKDGKIVFGMIAATLMACPEPQMTQEGTAFQVMNGTVGYEINGKTLTISAADNTVILTLSSK